ncbi:hypothetical protein Tco_0491686 [Tanacetum coccineum]
MRTRSSSYHDPAYRRSYICRTSYRYAKRYYKAKVVMEEKDRMKIRRLDNIHLSIDHNSISRLVVEEHSPLDSTSILTLRSSRSLRRRTSLSCTSLRVPLRHVDALSRILRFGVRGGAMNLQIARGKFLLDVKLNCVEILKNMGGMGLLVRSAINGQRHAIMSSLTGFQGHIQLRRFSSGVSRLNVEQIEV